MIIFLSNPFHRYTHKKLCRRKDIPEVCCKSYDWLLRQRTLPHGTYIFTDRERMDSWELRIFQCYYNHINQLGEGYRAINNPGTMLNRRALLRKLYSRGINPINVYAVTERVLPQQYPVFIRNENDHQKPLTPLLQTKEELENALLELADQGVPEEGLLITEYCAQALEGTLFRKLSSYKTGDQIFFYRNVHEKGWLVKYGTNNIATQAMYEEEQSMIIQNAYHEEMATIFELAGIEYGRADFGIVDNRVVVYEINTNPDTQPPSEIHDNATRQENINLGWKKYCSALHQIDSPAVGKKQKAPCSVPGLRRPRFPFSFLRTFRP